MGSDAKLFTGSKNLFLWPLTYSSLPTIHGFIRSYCLPVNIHQYFIIFFWCVFFLIFKPCIFAHSFTFLWMTRHPIYFFYQIICITRFEMKPCHTIINNFSHTAQKREQITGKPCAKASTSTIGKPSYQIDGMTRN